MSEIPIKCRICYHCNREERFCQWEDGDNASKLPFTEDCDEFKFEVLFLIDVLEELAK